MGTYSSYSYDVDNPSADVVSQTDYHTNGSVHQYDSKDGDFNTHSHTVYGSGRDHALGNNPSYDRNINDPSSANRGWNNRRAFLDILQELSFAELQQVEALSTNEYVRQSARHFMQIANNFDLEKNHTFRF